jgi:hypothetical protein
LQSDVDGFLIENGGEGDLVLTVSSGQGCATLGHTRLLPGSSVRIPRSAIGASPPRFDHPAGCTGVFVWKSPGRDPDLFSSEQSEAWKKLRALGYIH